LYAAKKLDYENEDDDEDETMGQKSPRSRLALPQRFVPHLTAEISSHRLSVAEAVGIAWWAAKNGTRH